MQVLPFLCFGCVPLLSLYFMALKPGQQLHMDALADMLLSKAQMTSHCPRLVAQRPT
jgi:hypothetical protein